MVAITPVQFRSDNSRPLTNAAQIFGRARERKEDQQNLEKLIRLKDQLLRQGKEREAAQIDEQLKILIPDASGQQGSPGGGSLGGLEVPISLQDLERAPNRIPDAQVSTGGIQEANITQGGNQILSPQDFTGGSQPVPVSPQVLTPKERRARIRLGLLDKGAADRFTKGLERADKRSVDAFDARNLQNLRMADFILKGKDELEMHRRIRQIAEDETLDSEQRKEIERLSKIDGFDLLKAGVERSRAFSLDYKTIIGERKNRLDRAASLAEKIQATPGFEMVVDENKQPIAQRNTRTGEIKSLPETFGGKSTQNPKGTFSKGIGTPIELEDGSIALSIPVLDTRSGTIVNKVSPMQGQPVSRLGETAKEQTERSIEQAGGITRTKGEQVRLQTTIAEGIEAAEGLATLNRSIKLMDTIKTGGFAGALLRFKNVLGVQGADETELTTNTLRTVLAQLKPTFGAQFTEREGTRLERIESGIGKSTAGNIRIMKQLKTIVERAARRGIAAANKTGDDFSAKEIQDLMDFKLEAPIPPPPPGAVIQGGTVKKNSQ